MDQERSWKTPFFTVWAGQAFSLLGSQIVQFALIWWLTSSAGSATALTTAFVLFMLPEIFLGPFAGALIDRWNRRTVMMVADSVVALASAVMAFLFYANAIQLWHVYLIALIRALGGTFHWPAMTASTTMMVPQKHLARIGGLNQTLFGAFSILGPPVGALLLHIMSLHAIIAIDVATAALAVIPLFFIHIPQPVRKAAKVPQAKPSFWHDLREGLHYVWSWPGLMAALVLATLVNFVVNPAYALTPILVARHFGGGPLQLGWINSATGVGIVLGGLILSAWGGFHRRVHTTLFGVIGLGVGTVVLGLTPAWALWLALAAVLLKSMFNSIANGSLEATLQATIAPEMQGRVLTVVGSLTRAVAPISMAVSGPLADRFGVRIWFVAGGVACALLALSALFIPAIVHLEDHQDRPPTPALAEEAYPVEELVSDKVREGIKS